MRYAQGGGLTAEGRRRRELVRLAAVERFEQRVPVPEIAAELRVSERSVQRWRRAWEAGGAPGLASKGQAARCRLEEAQLAELDRLLGAGPAAAGWQDQRWTLGRVRDLIAGRFGVQYTVPGPGTCCAAAGGAASWAPAGPPSGTRSATRTGGSRRAGRCRAPTRDAAPYSPPP
jgi:transposase